jgi:hypothetical protein
MLRLPKRCYVCGKTAEETPEGKLTKDHLPPKNLFPKPRPANLITVPCCYSCNNSAHNDDEYFRIAVSCMYNADKIGKQLWKDKVVGSTVRKRRLRTSLDKLNASFKRIALITPQGIEDAVEGALQAAPVKRVLLRITKGLLYKLYPQIERSCLTFKVSQLDPFKVNDPSFNQIRHHLHSLQRGDGVYRCWYEVDTSYSWKGLWVHMFFGSAWFLIDQTSDRTIELPF